MPSKPVTGFLEPIPFQEALDKFAARKIAPSLMRTKDWQAQPLEIRERSLWSAGVTNAKFLQHTQNLLTDYLKETVVTLPDGSRMLKVGGRAEFIRRMMEFVKAEGIPRVKRGTIQDIGGSQRLGLIFDVQQKQAQEYGYWKQGQAPEILEAYPCQRFVRIFSVKVPRPLHLANTGAVRPKADVGFWLAMNDPGIGGFGVPWGPWGFNSGMGTEEVSVKEAARLGFKFPAGEVPAPPRISFSSKLWASAKGLGTRLKAKLTAIFAGAVQEKGDDLLFTPAEPGIEPEP